MGLWVLEVFEGETDPDAPSLVRELVRWGVRVEVVGPPMSVADFDDTRAALTPLAVGTGVGSLAALRRVLRGEQAGADGDRAAPDVVHAHGLRAAVAVALARTGDTPLVVTLTELPPVAGAAALVGRAITRGVFPVAAAVLAPTTDLVAAITRLGATEARLVRPPLPEPSAVTRTPSQVREELALPPGPIVLAQARLRTDTRLDVLVDAAARWRGPDGPQVVLAGVGPAYRELVARAMVARAPVTFAGVRVVPATAADRNQLDSAAPAITLRTAAGTDRTATGTDRTTAGAKHGNGDGAAEARASLDEVLATSAVAVVTDPRARPDFALRAARAGVALVVPQGGVVADLLGGGARPVPPGDVDALHDAVRALLDDDAARAELAAAARTQVADWPDAAAVAAELAGLYEKVSRPTAAPLADTPGELQ